MSEPSNKELRAEIKKLSEELGIEVTPGNSKAQLLEQLKELRRRLEERAAESSTPPAPSPLAGGAVRADAASSAPTDAAPPPAPEGELDGSSEPEEPNAGELEADAGDAPPPDVPPTPLELELEAAEEKDEELARHLRDALSMSPEELARESRSFGDTPLNRAHLAAMVASLRTLARELAPLAPHIARELEARARSIAPEPPPEPPLESPPSSGDALPPRGYKVAEGRSLTSKRGVLGPGEEVQVRDLFGDARGIEERLEELADKGVLVRT